MCCTTLLSSAPHCKPSTAKCYEHYEDAVFKLLLSLWSTLPALDTKRGNECRLHSKFCNKHKARSNRHHHSSNCTSTFCILEHQANDYALCLSKLLNLLEGIQMFYLNTHSQLDHLRFLKSKPNCNVLLTLCLNDSDKEVLSCLLAQAGWNNFHTNPYCWWGPVIIQSFKISWSTFVLGIKSLQQPFMIKATLSTLTALF